MVVMIRYSAAEAVQDTRSCRHRWLIDPPNEQETSRGICKSCGTVRRFANALDAHVPNRFQAGLRRPPTETHEPEGSRRCATR